MRSGYDSRPRVTMFILVDDLVGKILFNFFSYVHNLQLLNVAQYLNTYSGSWPGAKVLLRVKVIFLGVSLIFLFVKGPIYGYKSFVGICEQVIDGDTIIVRGQRIRLAYIDAPEIGQVSRDRKLIGQKSKAYLEKLISGKKVQIKYKKRGRYGRIIGHVFLAGKDINLKMVSSGFSFIYGSEAPLNYFSDHYLAKLERRGIFAAQSFEIPWYFRKLKRAGGKRPPKY